MTLDPHPDQQAQSASDEPTFITANGGDDTVEVVRGKLANYEVLNEIARGGMGVVYRARQISADRIVALKVVRGHDPDAAEVERFLTEARAAARLEHPHIVPVYEVGEVAGEPYFSMRLIDGPSLSQQLSGQPLPCRDAAALVKTIADAIQYAHDRGIIHRDLKPGNILMDKSGQPHVTDFGLARMIDGASELTQSGQVVGTPSYMPPEQALGQREKVDERSDVYSVGAILYSCLTGRPPFRAASATATIMQLLSREVVPPGRLNSEIDVDLETICLKCLEKEPLQRYATAQELAADLQRYLEGKPILARPASVWERVSKWARRNPTVAALSGFAAVAVLTLLTGGAVYQSYLTEALVEAQTARDSAVDSEAQRTATLYDSLVEQADYLNRLRPVGYGDNVLAMVDRARQLKTPAWNDKQLRQLAVSSMGDSASRMPVAFPTFTSQPMSFNATPDGRFVFVGMESGQVAICHRDNLNDCQEFSDHSQPVIGIRFPDEHTCYTATIFCGEIMKWTFDGTSWQPSGMLERRCPEGATDIRLSHDGRYVIGWTSCSPLPGTMQYVCTEAPQAGPGFPSDKSVFYVREVDSAEDRLRILPIPASAAFDMREHVFVAINGGDDTAVKVLHYDLNAGKTRYLEAPDFHNYIALSPNLDCYVCGSYRGATSHRTEDGKRIDRVLNASTYSAQFIGSSSLVSVRGGKRQTIVPLDNPDGAWRLSMSENSDEAVFASDGSCVFEFNLESGKATMSQTDAPECQVWRDDQRGVDDVNFSNDGTVIVCSRADQHVQLRSALNGQLLAEIPGSRAVLHPSGNLLAVAQWGSVQVLQVPELKELCRANVPGKGFHRLRFSPDGQFLVGYGWDGPNTAVFRCDADAEKPELTFLTELDSDCNSAAWSPETHRLAWVSRGASTAEHRVMLRDFDAPTSDAVPLGFRSPYQKFCSLAFPNDQQLVFFNQEEQLQLWDLKSDTLVHSSSEKLGRPLVASSDGRYLLASGTLVSADTLQVLCSFPGLASDPWAADWSRTGEQIVIGHNGGEITVWDLTRVRAAVQALNLDFPTVDAPHITPSEALATLTENPHASAQKATSALQLDDSSQWNEALTGFEKRLTLDELTKEVVELKLQRADQIPMIVQRLYAASEWPPMGHEKQAVQKLVDLTQAFAEAHHEKRLTLPEFESLMESCLQKFNSLKEPSVVSQAVTAFVLDGYATVIAKNEAREVEGLRYREACVQHLQSATSTGVLSKVDFGTRWFWVHVRCATLANTLKSDALAIRMFHEALTFSDSTGYEPRPELQKQYARAVSTLLAKNEDAPERQSLLQRFPELLELQPNPTEKDSWSLLSIDPAEAELKIVDELIELSVTKAGTQSFHAQISMNPPLLDGHTYRLSFEACSPSSATIDVDVARAVPDYRPIGVHEQLKLQPTFQPVIFSFVAKGVAESSRVSFSMGTQVGSMQLRNLKLEEVLPLTVDQQ